MRVRTMLHARGLCAFDSFRISDSDRDGFVSCSELWGLLTYLGIEVKKPELYALMNHVDHDRDGKLSFEEYVAAFPDDEDAIADIEIDLDKMNIPPRAIAELSDLSGKSAELSEFYDIVEHLSENVISNFRIKLKPVSSYTKVWTSEGSSTSNPVSVWRPSLENSSMWQSGRQRCCLGYYVNNGFEKPKPVGGGGFFSRKSSSTEERNMIEVYDKSGAGSRVLKAVTNVLCPHPVRYRQLWFMKRGAIIFIWEPVPPSDDFVALGVIATTKEEPPPLLASRCVPRRWCGSRLKPRNKRYGALAP